MKFPWRYFPLAALMIALSIPGLAGPAGQKTLDSCSLLTKAEIQAVLEGQTVSDPKMNPNGLICEFKIGEYGVLSFFVKQNNPKDYADKMQSELKKRNIATSDLKNVGDRSFFAEPGYGMIQLNSFKGSTYVLLTMLVPGAAPEKGKAMAEKLMLKALAKV
jgi:hypothetical protein